MAYSKWHDVLIRAGRTFVQGFIGILALIAVPVLNDLVQTVAAGGVVEIDVNVWQSIGIAGIAGGVVALIALGQNWIEETRGKSIGPK